jgi:branched-chain amino acid transport system ATP-binding protein
MRSTLLEVSNLNAFYGDVQILYDINLNVKKGEIIAIVGANAAGKTTLLSAISGVLSKYNGTIKLNGKDIQQIPSFKRVDLGLTLVPEGRHLFPEMTVYENLEMGAYSKKASQLFTKNLEYVYDLLPILKEKSNQQASTLSGGQAQMCAIARGLMANPSIIMLDEPSLGLAPVMVHQLLDLIKQINASGCTVILVEQNIHYSLGIADRAYVLENGRIVLDGDARTLLHDDRIKNAYLGL